MNNWKIGARISAGFCCIIVIAALLGSFAYLKLGTIDASTAQATAEDVTADYVLRPKFRASSIANAGDTRAFS